MCDKSQHNPCFYFNLRIPTDNRFTSEKIMRNRPSSISGLFTITLLLIASASFLTGCSGQSGLHPPRFDSIQQGFTTPQDTNNVWCYYYWINDDISREGVTKDLEAMKKFGIGAVLIGNINPALTDGRVPLFSEEWWDITVHTVNEGQRLGIDIGFFNCPGWSQSGGPWISADKAMRHLVFSETRISGPGPVSLILEKPAKEFQDTHVLAFRSIEAEAKKIDHSNAKISAEPVVQNLENWIDGDLNTEALFEVSRTANYTITIHSENPIHARSVILHPGKAAFKCNVEILAKTGDSFTSVRQFVFDRSNPRVNVGPVTHGPVAVSIPETVAGEFQVVCNQFSGNARQAGFSEIVITESQVLERYIEKTLGKMHPTPLPDFGTYLWTPQKSTGTEGLIVDDVADISDKMDQEGRLNWDAPDGNWTILRMGMTPTGTENSPAAPQGTGYEVDKASAELALYHFDQFMGEIIRRVPKESLPALKYVIADSYEMGSQNWTDGFETRFESKYGYNPIQYLPVFSGRIVGSIEESERFLWDLRRAVADDIAYEYVGGLRKASNGHNLKLWLENYGHWGFPSEFLMYGGQSDLVSGEYWNEGSLGDIECKSASSAAHIYGKHKTSAESYTAAQQSYRRHPAMLKKRGDWSLTEGINHHVLHVYIQQPDDERIPGINAWFSTEFNRHNTWFDQGSAWVDYLRRCQHLLQQGKYAADVCYFIGEDAPKMTGARDPELPDGYSYDYINAEVILNRLSVKNGRLMLPDGMNYGLMVLPRLTTMRPEVISKIEELVKQGAMVLGPKPERSPSLQGYPQCDELVSQAAARLWPDTYEKGKLVNKYGKGYILDGMDISEALALAGLSKDVDPGAEVPVLWTHRTMPGMEIYFLTNQGETVIEFEPSFRVKGLSPQLWDAVTGEIRKLNEYTVKDGRTSVLLKMEPLQSWFIVFTKAENPLVAPGFSRNFPDPQTLVTIDQPWSVEFLNTDIGPEEPVPMPTLTDWTSSEDDRIRYYSGTAVYTTTFTVDKLPANGKLMLNLGEVGVMARATLNGAQIGTAWMAPYLIPAGSHVKEGANILKLEVVNTWRNRMVKDASLPENQRYTWTIVTDARPDEKLQPSGLKGPVTIELIR